MGVLRTLVFDPRFANNVLRVQRRDELTELLQREFKKKTTAQ